MTREEFIQKSMWMGIGLPFLTSVIAACSKEVLEVPAFKTDFSGKVIVLGAGASGLAAGYLLQRYGVDFQVIEAGETFGGRVKRAQNFVDFPIDIGAEWIHASPSVLSDILDNPDLNASIDFIHYNPQTFAAAEDGYLQPHNYASNFYSEHKFKSTTWFGFFERFIVPEFENKIVYNQPIVEINHSGDKVILTSEDGTVYEADKVIVTAPIKVLRDEVIAFTPHLPQAKLDAIESISMGDGLKVFIEFEERFYPDLFVTGAFLSSLSGDDKIFYDAAFRKDSNAHVLGLFTINKPASAYTSLDSDQEIIDAILEELDQIFDGKASKHYKQHVVQNWSKEPYVRGSYSYTFENNQWDTVEAITKPVEGKLFFAGEALSIDNQATVHGACESGYSAVEKVLT